MILENAGSHTRTGTGTVSVPMQHNISTPLRAKQSVNALFLLVGCVFHVRQSEIVIASIVNSLCIVIAVLHLSKNPFHRICGCDCSCGLKFEASFRSELSLCCDKTLPGTKDDSPCQVVIKSDSNPAIVVDLHCRIDSELIWAQLDSKLPLHLDSQQLGVESTLPYLSPQ
ncbi:hypothetical protein RJT34_04106 [Clitoria ternatea]|uniref:Uncharacterized protein n=1 Tax=Clitoria ternatea TaxID=43366 RepID=A0AAN9Q0B3_CLITE